MVLPKLSNEDFINLKRRRKTHQARKRRLEKRIERDSKTLEMTEYLIDKSREVDEIYKGIALHHIEFLGRGWVRCDEYNSSREYRRGRYWDNAHNPGKGEWNIELQWCSWRGGLPNEESKFFKFKFGTEDQCIEACKEWVAFGKMPRKE